MIPEQASQLSSSASAITIKRLTHSMLGERAEVAKIHISELPDSELSVLGEAFLRHFYYGFLLTDPDYYCYIYQEGGHVAGFTAFSTDSASVCRRGILRAWPRMAWILMAEIFRRPLLIAAIMKLAASFFSPKRAPCAEIKAEAMSTAVAGPYCSVEYFRRTGTNIAQALYLTVAWVLHARGVKQIKGLTRKSNVLVNASLNFLGWQRVLEIKGSVVWVWDTEAAVKKFNKPSFA